MSFRRESERERERESESERAREREAETIFPGGENLSSVIVSKESKNVIHAKCARMRMYAHVM